MTLKVLLTENNIDDFLYRYIVENNKLVMIDNENKNLYINKVVNMRSTLFCNGKTFCNKCAGELYYKMGIKNFGLTAGTIGSKIMNESMKKFHDMSLKYSIVTNIEDYIEPY